MSVASGQSPTAPDLNVGRLCSPLTRRNVGRFNVGPLNVGHSADPEPHAHVTMRRTANRDSLHASVSSTSPSSFAATHASSWLVKSGENPKRANTGGR
jgi:hypothetical protein